MIKTVLIDDEINALDSLKNVLTRYVPSVKIVGIASNMKDGLESISREKPDLLFLDVVMPEGTGFDLLNRVTDGDFEVIFVTAYDQYALRAFEFSAIHYVLKPYHWRHIDSAIGRYEKVKHRETINKRLQSLEQNLLYDGKYLVLSTNTEMKVIETSKIVYCESSDNYTIFHLDGGKKMVVTKPLYHYASLLNRNSFFRIHTRFLINLRYLESYVKGRGGYVVMKDGSELDVSIRKKKEFLEFMSEYF